MLMEQAMCVWCVYVCVCMSFGVFSVCESCEQWPVFVTVDYKVLLIILNIGQ